MRDTVVAPIPSVRAIRLFDTPSSDKRRTNSFLSLEAIERNSAEVFTLASSQA